MPIPRSLPPSIPVCRAVSLPPSIPVCRAVSLPPAPALTWGGLAEEQRYGILGVATQEAYSERESGQESRGAMQHSLHTIPRWLDSETSALVRDKIEMLISRHSDILAIILYGSVVRHEERSIDEPDPSDVNLLAVFDGDRSSIRPQELALSHTMGLAENRHLQAPREVNVMFSSRTTQEWDPPSSKM
jgi:predicted nucleotidyltransferase